MSNSLAIAAVTTTIRNILDLAAQSSARSMAKVTIGRVDVRAPGPRLAAPAPRTATSLDEYLRQRNRGER